MGDTKSLVIEADENLMPHIITEVRGSTLIIRIEEDIRLVNMISDVKYTLTAKSLNSIELSGLGNISISPLQTPTP